ncbi:protein NLRC3-like isoform X2 [Protopterus annectens]|uniref:protein NLRC3-like isoform X2 n=1 Tax=Protopterus annectens TaxID=7888 RepID=UPI001CFC074C|nr:protein NLRC3-like isoform X2 [Protopterus annectens]
MKVYAKVMDVGREQMLLKGMRPTLVEKWSDQIERILDASLSERIITREDDCTVRSENTEMEKMRTLLDILDCRGNGACKKFILMLKSDRFNKIPSKPVSHSAVGHKLTDQQHKVNELDQSHISSCFALHWKILAQRHGIMDEYIANGKRRASFGERYTDITVVRRELYVSQRQHEVTEVRNSFRNIERQHSSICQRVDICEALLNGHTGLTLISGVAGSGKTTVIKKVIQVWAVKFEESNVVMPLVLFFSLRDLNLITESISLMQLMVSHYNHLKTVWEQLLNSEQHRLLLIFDGLDEFKFHLHFGKIQTCSDPELPQHISGIIVNIIKGHLLPDCAVVLTSRPHAICKIPEMYIKNFYQIFGFSSEQQKEYFKKACASEACANKIWEYVSVRKPLSLMCHIPAFCWITSTALQEKDMSLDATDNATTVTDIYCRFLKAIVIFHGVDKDVTSVQCLVNARESLEIFRNCLNELGGLAFKGLMEQKFIFDPEDLPRCNVSQGCLSSLFMVEVLREDQNNFAFHKTYHFLHTSVQEFCAALFYVMESYSGRNPFLYLGKVPLSFFHKVGARMLRMCGTERLLRKRVKEVCFLSSQSPTGHLDLFCRFVCGLLVPETFRILEGIFSRQQAVQDVHFLIKVLHKQLTLESLSPERLVNVCHCLYEARDPALRERLEQLSSDFAQSNVKSSAIGYTELAFVLQLTSDVELLDLENSNLGPVELWRLMPVLPYFRTLRLAQNPLGPEGAAILAEVLRDPNCRTENLWIVGTKLGSEGAKYICEGLLKNSTVKNIRMACNSIGDVGAISLAEVLKRNTTLKDIRFFDNKISAEWVQRLKRFAKSRNGLEILICD